jgi:integrase
MAELTLNQQIAQARAEVARLEALAHTSRPIQRRLRDKLTDRRIKTLADGFHGDGGCLYLRVRDGRKSWIVRHKDRDRGLGAYPEVGLAEARGKRDTLLKKLAGGCDPNAERREQQQAAKLTQRKHRTFRQCAEAFINGKADEWKNPRHRNSWESSLQTIAYPVLGDIDVALIDVSQMLQALEPVWKTKTKTAADTRARIEAVLSYAAVKGYRPRDVLNPAVWKANLDQVLAKPGKIHTITHRKALPYAEAPALWEQLVASGTLNDLAVRLALLTGTRSGEVLKARWTEIDEKTRVWTIPAERMKGGVLLRVPLSDAAFTVLAELRKLPASPFLFPSMLPRKGRPPASVGPMTMRRALARLGYAGQVDPHGFRATLRGWGKQRGFREEALELALAHNEGSKTQKAYDREDLLEERRGLMEAWAYFLTGAEPAREVVPFPEAQQAA